MKGMNSARANRQMEVMNEEKPKQSNDFTTKKNCEKYQKLDVGVESLERSRGRFGEKIDLKKIIFWVFQKYRCTISKFNYYVAT